MLPWIWKPSFGSTFSILSHWFDISSSQNTQEAGPYIWRSPERDCIHFMQVATFIMQNWCIYTIWSCPPRKIDIGKDEFHSYTEEGIFTIRCSDRLWGGVWSDMATEQVSGRITWECRITENTLAKWCVSFCIHRVSQMRSPMAARLSLLSSIVRHVTWDQPNKQIWGSSCGASKLIYCSMGIIMAISFHCLAYGITGDSSVNCQYAEEVGQQLQQPMVGKKVSLLPKMKKKVKVMTLEAMTSSIALHGKKEKWAPKWYAFCKAQLIFHLLRCMS